jgi:integrase
MQKQNISVNELVEQTMQAMRTLGFTEYSVWSIHASAYSPMKKYFQIRGINEYDSHVMEEYRTTIEKQFVDGAIKKMQYDNYIRAIDRLAEVYLTGKLEWSIKTRISRFKLNPAFEQLRKDFLSSREFGSTKAVKDYSWVIRKYLSYLMEQGHGSIDTVEVRDICNFLHFCSDTLKPGSLHNVVCYTRQFHEYLDKAGLIFIPYKGALSFKVKREMKIQPPVAPDEVRRVLEQINIATDTGKRDLAIILLGAKTGLRAIDIIHLKLKDIEWRSDGIRIVQQKSRGSLALPLDEDVAQAIGKYILEVRPEVDCEYVFLTRRFPYRKLNDSFGVQDIWKWYQEKAGIARKPFDGKGFHGLRRLLGKEMAVHEVPVTTIAQVLGQREINSVRPYISLDSVHLKMCALGFGGIEILGGDA